MDPIIRRYRKLVFFTWFLTLDLVLFGAFVRLTDSGLGCPDWPGCYGHATPFGALATIHQAYREMPWGPVSLSKAWIEMIHRYVASLLGLLIMVIAYYACRYRSRLRHSPVLALVTFVVVCGQGAFGAWTVTYALMPGVVTMHLLLGMLTLALMTWLAVRERPCYVALPSRVARWRYGMLGGLVLLGVQIALGAWVSTNYAALACMDFPFCQGRWFPPMDFAKGYTLIRALGKDATGGVLTQAALTAIHWGHRNMALFVFIYLGVLVWPMRAVPGLQGPATGLLMLLLAQLGTGVAIIFLKWPLLIAVLHTGIAAGLVMVSVMLMVRLTNQTLVPAHKET